MTLLHLCLQANLNFAVAHCNFQLRPESDEEEVFLKGYCAEKGVDFFVKRFPTAALRESSGKSIQMLARDLRYEWFENIREKEGFDFIAIAQHQNDVVETVINNLSRGTGIAGTHGIKARSGNVLRPLLPFGKAEIAKYVAAEKIPFREDASNASLKYDRNFIRHEVVPDLEKLNPKAVQSIAEFARRQEQAEILLKPVLEKWSKKLVSDQGGDLCLNIGLLKHHPAKELILYETLKGYGFNGSQVAQILSAPDRLTGKVFESEQHRLIQNRGKLLLADKAPEKQSTVFIEESTELVQSNRGALSFEVIEKKDWQMSDQKNIADFDLKKVKFPLTWRPKLDGDFFYPLGMTKPNSHKVGKKKVAKYFKDQKLSLLEKERSSILLDAKKRVLCLVNQRMDNRAKVTDKTTKVLRVRFTEAL